MFIVIKESEGDHPSVSAFEDLGAAEVAFGATELDKYATAVHLVSCSTGVFGCQNIKSRWFADGEETVWIHAS